MLISVIGWTTRRPFARHQRKRVLLREGTRIPGPSKDSAEAMSACRSTFGLGRGVAEEGEVRRVSRDAAAALDHARRAMLDCLCEFGGAIEAVDTLRERVARVKIGRAGGSNGAAGNGSLGSPALHAGEGFANVKSERRVEGQRAIVKGGLYQADSCRAALVRAVNDGFHELAADAPVLDGRVDGDGADAVDDGALVEAVAAEDAAVAFGDDAVDAGCGEEHGDDAGGYISVGEVAGKTVSGVDGCRRRRNRSSRRWGRPAGWQGG